MLPSLKPGDIVLVKKKWFFCKIEKGDIVVLYDPRMRQQIIKRVVASNLGKYYAQGDNTQKSTDSRTFGWISKNLIIGKVIQRLS
jgi:nickel-type superoxide dismutase maturation protease